MPAAPVFDPRDAATQARPYTLYEQLRQHDPVHRSPHGMWVLSRYEDVRAALRDPRLSSRPSRFSVHARPALQGTPAARLVRDMVMFQDPPEHTRLRRLLARVITDNLAADLRGRIQQCVDELLAPALVRGEMDLLADFALPLPVHVIAELLGIPAPDRPQLKQWSASLFRVFSPVASEEGLAQLNAAVEAFGAYLRPLIAARRAAPQRDVISSLVQLRDEDDALSDDELVTTCILLFANGEETFAHWVGNGMLALLQQPQALARLRETPALARSGVEELLRYDSPAQTVGRAALEPITLHGRTIPAGVPVYLLLGAANRDPARFESPDRLELERADNEHLGFGAGRHACLGAGIARVEAQVAIGTLVQRLHGLRLADAPLSWRADFFLRGLQRLPVRFTPAPVFA